jgi:hypothetical protein
MGEVLYLKRLIEFLNKLEDLKIFYRLNKVRDAIMVEIAVPGERWEVEFMKDNKVVIERFISDGIIKDERELEVLFRDFSD